MDVKKKKFLCTVGENVNSCSYYGKHYRGYSKIKSKIIKNRTII